MLAKIGVKVTLLAQTKSKYFGKVLAQNGYDTSFFLLGWTPLHLRQPQPHLVADGVPGGGEDKIGAFNLGGYCNPRNQRARGADPVGDRFRPSARR